mmetsp:Transcript_15951/g.49987  ORF Transcript_15951/g.49987 Transcript_15951/m.49987 type:complete len:392 (+) Transcript_15951:80-1255(+)
MNLQEMSPDEVGRSELLFVSFNQDNGCFACGTESGFRIYNVSPFKETFRRVFSGGGIGIVEMLFRCNLLALVGGGRCPRYPPNKVMIWDDHQNRCIGELSFRSDVKAVKLRRDRVVVALNTKVYVYRFSDLKLLDQINTLPNPRGLVALCPHPSATVLACPGVTRGHVRVELYETRKSTIASAHESDLARLALNGDGSLVATASDKGTLIRIFDTQTGEQLRELRRGVDRAVVYCIAFDQSSRFVACTSDKGTAHIFSIEEPAENTKSNLSFLRRVVPAGLASSYLESEWSFAQVRGLDAPTLCAFGHQPNTIVLIAADGAFLVSAFKNPGECDRLTFARFIRDDADDAAADDRPPWGDAAAAAAQPPSDDAPKRPPASPPIPVHNAPADS